MPAHRMLIVSCIAAIATMVVTSQTNATVTFTGPASSFIFGANAGDVTELSPLTTTDTASGFTLTGDIQFGSGDIVNGLEGEAGITATRFFDVGPLPVEVIYDIFRDFKFVIGNGNAVDPDTDIMVSTAIQQMGAALPGTQISAMYSREGNGFTVISDSDSFATPFVLAPNFTYQLLFQMRFDLANQPFPAGELIIEFGGVSGFAGFDFVMDHRVVPEPGTGALLTLGVLALIGFRRRRRIH